jgi:hypothetical protein
VPDRNFRGYEGDACYARGLANYSATALLLCVPKEGDAKVTTASVGVRKSSRRRDSKGGLIISLILLVAFYYLWYRYPFQFGDVRTSPTYSPTPFWLQITKYAILGTILPFAWWRLRPGKSPYALLEVVIFVFFAVGTSACVLIAAQDFGMASRLFEIGFMLLFAIPLAGPHSFQQVTSKFFNFLKIFFWINLAAYAVQLWLFTFYERLPSLAYRGGNTRFGGIWDDPNSALAPFALYVPYVLVKRGFKPSTILLVILMISALILAQSGTSLVAIFLASGLVFMFFSHRMRPSTKVIVATAGGFAGLIVISLGLVALLTTPGLDLSRVWLAIDEAVRMKQGSTLARSHSYAILADANVWTFVGINPVMKAGENQLINILVNFGLPSLAVFLFIHFKILHNLYRWTRTSRGLDDYAMAVACSCFFIWYFTSMLNLPMAEVFPINLIAAIVAGMSIAARPGSRTQRVVRAAPGRDRETNLGGRIRSQVRSTGAPNEQAG